MSTVGCWLPRMRERRHWARLNVAYDSLVRTDLHRHQRLDKPMNEQSNVGLRKCWAMTLGSGAAYQ